MDRPKGTELCPPQSPKAMNQELNNGTNFTARRRVLKGMAAMPLAGTLVACGGNPADATNTPPTTSAPIGGGTPPPPPHPRTHARPRRRPPPPLQRPRPPPQRHPLLLLLLLLLHLHHRPPAPLCTLAGCTRTLTLRACVPKLPRTQRLGRAAGTRFSFRGIPH